MKRILVVILGLLLLAGCGTPPQVNNNGTAAPPVIALWHSYQGSALQGLQQAVDQLNKGNNAYQLQLVYVPQNQIVQQVTQAEAAGKGPDLFLVNQSEIPQLSTAKLIQPLDNEFDYNNYFQAAIQAVTYNGSVMAVPQSIDVPLMVTNQDLVKNPVTSLEQLIKTAGSYGGQGLAGNLSNIFLSGALYSAYGGQFNTQNPQSAFTSPQTVSFLQEIAALRGIKGGTYDPATSSSMLAGGKTPFGLLDSSEVSIYKGMGKHLAFSQMVGPGGNSGKNYVSVNGFVVGANSAYAREAADAAAKLSLPSYMSLYAVSQGQYPANPSAYDQPPLSTQPDAQVVRNIAASGTGYPLDSRTNQLLQILSGSITDVLNGTDPNIAFQTAETSAAKVLGANK